MRILNNYSKFFYTEVELYPTYAAESNFKKTFFYFNSYISHKFLLSLNSFKSHSNTSYVNCEFNIFPLTNFIYRLNS